MSDHPSGMTNEEIQANTWAAVESKDGDHMVVATLPTEIRDENGDPGYAVVAMVPAPEVAVYIAMMHNSLMDGMDFAKLREIALRHHHCPECTPPAPEETGGYL